MNIFVPNLNVCTTGKYLKGMFFRIRVCYFCKNYYCRRNHLATWFCFYKQPFDVEGKAALLGMNNKEVGGKTLFVSATKDSLHLNLLPHSKDYLKF